MLRKIRISSNPCELTLEEQHPANFIYSSNKVIKRLRRIKYKAKIKDGALVGQDFSYSRWKDDGTTFDVYYFTKVRAKCIAYGYGEISEDGKSYGNGALYVDREDLVYLE